jgi:hypothetical protein
MSWVTGMDEWPRSRLTSSMRSADWVKAPGGEDVAEAVEGPGPVPVGLAGPADLLGGGVPDVAPQVRPPRPLALWGGEQQPVGPDLVQASLHHDGEVGVGGGGGEHGVALARLLGRARVSPERVSTTCRSMVMRRRAMSTRLALSATCSPQRIPLQATSRTSSSRHHTRAARPSRRRGRERRRWWGSRPR